MDYRSAIRLQAAHRVLRDFWIRLGNTQPHTGLGLMMWNAPDMCVRLDPRLYNSPDEDFHDVQSSCRLCDVKIQIDGTLKWGKFSFVFVIHRSPTVSLSWNVSRFATVSLHNPRASSSSFAVSAVVERWTAAGICVRSSLYCCARVSAFAVSLRSIIQRIQVYGCCSPIDDMTYTVRHDKTGNSSVGFSRTWPRTATWFQSMVDSPADHIDSIVNDLVAPLTSVSAAMYCRGSKAVLMCYVRRSVPDVDSWPGCSSDNATPHGCRMRGQLMVRWLHCRRWILPLSVGRRGQRHF